MGIKPPTLQSAHDLIYLLNRSRLWWPPYSTVTAQLLFPWPDCTDAVPLKLDLSHLLHSMYSKVIPHWPHSKGMKTLQSQSLKPPLLLLYIIIYQCHRKMVALLMCDLPRCEIVLTKVKHCLSTWLSPAEGKWVTPEGEWLEMQTVQWQQRFYFKLVQTQAFLPPCPWITHTHAINSNNSRKSMTRTQRRKQTCKQRCDAVCSVFLREGGHWVPQSIPGNYSPQLKVMKDLKVVSMQLVLLSQRLRHRLLTCLYK